MRKLLGILGDTFLFTFLIVIFVLPLLVSINLDPKVYTPTRPQVAGVSNNRQQNPYYSSNYSFKESISSTDGIIINDSNMGENTYELDIKLVNGYKSFESIKIGKVTNNASESLHIQFKLYIDKDALKNSSILANIDNASIELFNGTESLTQTYTLSPNKSTPIELDFNFSDPIHFESFVKLEINFIDSN